MRKLAWVGLLLTALLTTFAFGEAASATPFVDGENVHVVAWGETLSSISRRYGVTVNALAQANDIADPDFVRVGQPLVVPSDSPPVPSESPSLEGPIVHVVGPGETLSSIARSYDTTVWAIAVANSLANPSLILVNQTLVIPAQADVTQLPLPAPFLSVSIEPTAVLQGDTMVIRVETSRSVTLTAVLDDEVIRFARQGSIHVALAGVPCWSVPGNHTLVVAATDASGETISLSRLITVLAQEFPVNYITLTPEKSALLDPEIVAEEAERFLAVCAGFDDLPQWDGLFQAPLDGKLRVTSPFGTRRSYNGGPPTGYHLGVDYGAPAGTPVYASASGRVALAEKLQVRGNTVILDHGMGVFSAYFHMLSLEVEGGQDVAAGELVGTVGSTGLSTGAHLHWELRVAGVAVDPVPWTRQVIFQPS